MLPHHLLKVSSVKPLNGVLPLLLLYLLSIGVAWAFGRERKADTDNSDTGNDD